MRGRAFPQMARSMAKPKNNSLFEWHWVWLLLVAQAHIDKMAVVRCRAQWHGQRRRCAVVCPISMSRLKARSFSFENRKNRNYADALFLLI